MPLRTARGGARLCLAETHVLSTGRPCAQACERRSADGQSPLVGRSSPSALPACSFRTIEGYEPSLPHCTDGARSADLSLQLVEGGRLLPCVGNQSLGSRAE